MAMVNGRELSLFVTAKGGQWKYSAGYYRGVKNPVLKTTSKSGQPGNKERPTGGINKTVTHSDCSRAHNHSAMCKGSSRTFRTHIHTSRTTAHELP
jgi:hypothetical protein